MPNQVERTEVYSRVEGEIVVRVIHAVPSNRILGTFEVLGEIGGDWSRREPNHRAAALWKLRTRGLRRKSLRSSKSLRISTTRLKLPGRSAHLAGAEQPEPGRSDSDSAPPSSSGESFRIPSRSGSYLPTSLHPLLASQ